MTFHRRTLMDWYQCCKNAWLHENVTGPIYTSMLGVGDVKQRAQCVETRRPRCLQCCWRTFACVQASFTGCTRLQSAICHHVIPYRHWRCRCHLWCCTIPSMHTSFMKARTATTTTKGVISLLTYKNCSVWTSTCQHSLLLWSTMIFTSTSRVQAIPPQVRRTDHTTAWHVSMGFTSY